MEYQILIVSVGAFLTKIGRLCFFWIKTDKCFKLRIVKERLKLSDSPSTALRSFEAPESLSDRSIKFKFQPSSGESVFNSAFLRAEEAVYTLRPVGQYPDGSSQSAGR